MSIFKTKSASLNKELAPVFNIKELDESTGAFSGYGSVFNVVDSHNEKVLPGAFKKSLAESKKAKFMPKLFWQHRSDEPIGRWINIAEDEVGLLCEGQLNLSVQRGKEAHAHLIAKDVDGLSIGYREVKTNEPENDGDPRELVQVRLLEVSIVSLASNGLSRVLDVKSEKNWSRFEEFARAIRDGEPLPIKEFEDLLREAGVPKSMAVSIASVGYAKAIRSESGGENAGATELRDALRSFLNVK